jgi:putative tryptophan/tyrosine transport system substrate-binding protein
VFGLKLQTLDIRDASDFDSAFGAATKERSDAVLVLPSAYAFAERIRLVDLAAKNRLPVMYGSSEYVEAGGLMTYGVSFTDLFQRAAIYVDKILRGAKPAELPVEQPKKSELVINLKAAKQIGLVIPPNMLARADKVIK